MIVYTWAHVFGGMHIQVPEWMGEIVCVTMWAHVCAYTSTCMLMTVSLVCMCIDVCIECKRRNA